MAIVVQAAPVEDPARVVRRVAARAGLARWRIEPVATLAPNRGEFELQPPPRGRRPAPGGAWDITYRLRDQPEVMHAEPLFQYEVADLHRPPARRASGGGGDDPATNDDYEWSLKSANVIEAWDLFGARLPGAGVTVGHPDTGYTTHPEIADPSRLLVRDGYDFDDDDQDPVDDLDEGFLDNPGHGTGTSSVIMSTRGPSVGSTGREFVSGVAPHSSLIPIRTTESVVLFSMRALRHAIDHAIGKGAQVISISLGGPFGSSAIHSAIVRAVNAGTIVLAAAGNHVPFVVYPAAFEEVIAVAASTISDRPWSGSSRGDAVDITAPGASVWRASVVVDDPRPYRVGRGSGTSFAVATTAGVAALWLSYHGWTMLERRYGAGSIPAVFKTLLQANCHTPRGWDTGAFGSGIVDALAVLKAPLPAQPPARKLRDPRRAAVATDTTGLEAIVHLLPDAPRSGVERAVATMLGVPDRELPHILQDVGDELAFQLVMQPRLRDELEQRAKQPVTRARGAARRPHVTLNRRYVSRRLSRRL